jgi:hypothetical protein
MSLCLCLLFYSISLYFFFCASTMLFLLPSLCLKSGIVIPPVLLFWVRIALAIQGLLCFHVNFKMDFSISVKNVIGILIGVIEHIECFQQYSHFHNIDSAYP